MAAISTAPIAARDLELDVTFAFLWDLLILRIETSKAKLPKILDSAAYLRRTHRSLSIRIFASSHHAGYMVPKKVKYITYCQQEAIVV